VRGLRGGERRSLTDESLLRRRNECLTIGAAVADSVKPITQREFCKTPRVSRWRALADGAKAEGLANVLALKIRCEDPALAPPALVCIVDDAMAFDGIDLASVDRRDGL